MTTAGDLVIQGQVDGSFLVFDGTTGAKLRRIDAGIKMVAAPMTYRIDGEQYIAIMGTSIAAPGVKGSGDAGEAQGRIVAFKLDGGEVPQASPMKSAEGTSMPPVPDDGTPEQISRGSQLFARHCAVCHESASRAPNLADLTAQEHSDFMEIVFKGSRVTKGMPSFSNVLSKDEGVAIHAFITHRSWKQYHQTQNAIPPKGNGSAGCR